MAQATARLRSAFAKRRAGGAAGGGLEQGSLAQRILASARAQHAAEAAAADAGQAANRAKEAAGGQLHNIIRRLQVSSCTPGHAVAGAAQAADGAQPETGKCSLLASACTLWWLHSDGSKKSPSAPACHAVTARSQEPCKATFWASRQGGGLRRQAHAACCSNLQTCGPAAAKELHVCAGPPLQEAPVVAEVNDPASPSAAAAPRARKGKWALWARMARHKADHSTGAEADSQVGQGVLSAGGSRQHDCSCKAFTRPVSDAATGSQPAPVRGS